MGVGDASPRILGQMHNIKCLDLPDADRCCGGGGGLPARQPQIAKDLRDQKIATLQNTGANVAVCNEAMCALSLGRGIVPIKHIAELLAEVMGIDVTRF
jgi:L-lactate dehydrogenase complex protein LldE